MKAVILHGGQGTRLRPLTHTGPKQLIKIGGKPISQWGIESLISRGITEIAVILGDNNPKKVIEYYGDGRKFGAKITYIFQGQPLGLAHAVYLTRDFVGEDPFIVYLGDNIILDGIDSLIESNANCSILLSKVREPNRFGVAIVDNGEVKKLVEKPREFISDLALVGVYKFDKSIFQSIETLKPSWRGEFEITEAIQNLIDIGLKVDSREISGWWKDTGTPADLLEANNILLDLFLNMESEMAFPNTKIEGRVHIGKDVEISNSTIRGPAYIEDGSIIENSYIGPYSSIGEKCNITKSEISNSLIFDKVTLSDSTLLDSIIGSGAEIHRSELKPQGTRLIIGEGSKVYI